MRRITIIHCYLCRDSCVKCSNAVECALIVCVLWQPCSASIQPFVHLLDFIKKISFCILVAESVQHKDCHKVLKPRCKYLQQLEVHVHEVMLYACRCYYFSVHFSLSCITTITFKGWGPHEGSTKKQWMKTTSRTRWSNYCQSRK